MIIDPKQGAVKLDEVAVNPAMSVTATGAGEDALTVVDQIRKILADAHTKQNYMLYSSGRMQWTGSLLRFDADALANNMIYKLFMIDSDTTRTVDLIMTGTTGANTATTFNSITINNNELLYLELDRSLVAASGGTLVIENAINGGSLAVGKTLKKVLLTPTTGMPQLASPIGGNSDTLNIPIAYRNDNAGTQNLYFPAHGIRWPAGTESTLGAVLVDQNLTYPNYYAQNLVQFQSALTNLSGAGGGTVVLYGSFSVDSIVNIPDNVLVLGRGKEIELNFIIGGKLVVGNRSEIRNISLTGTVGFNSDAMVYLANTQSKVTDCKLKLQNVSGLAYSIKIDGNYNRIAGCFFDTVTASSFQIGINYNTGDNNSDIDCIFT